MKLHHLAVLTRDPVALAAFYRDTLDLEQVAVHTEPNSDRVRSVWLKLEGDALLMVERTDVSERAAEKTPGWYLLALRIGHAERQRWRERLAQRGIAIEAETAFTLYFRDLDGNRVGLSHHPVDTLSIS